MVDISELKDQILLKALSDEELKVIAERLQPKSYPKGQVIFKEGSSTEGIFLVHKGKVEISKTTPDGWQQTLAVFTQGHFFGELSVIEDKELHGATAKAVDNTEVLLLKKDDFKSLEESDLKMMYKIMKTIAQVACSNVHSMNERLMKVLISY
jgi:CRP/FNR family transcriptional regulator